MSDARQRDFGPVEFRESLRVQAEVLLIPIPILRGAVDPSDVVQQTLLRAYERLDQFGGHTRGEMAAWLRAILVRAIQNKIRSIHPCISLDAALGGSSARLKRFLAADDSSPQERAAREEDTFRLSEAVAQLPEDQRRAVELKHLLGWKVKAIAHEMGRTEHAVAGLLRRGLDRLRELLAERH
ncbi:MAG: sigma-70 family RNA polymerase sigma factor [Gemmataceae bacterium]|nr:sigma-70 family RNA polymerase sigma factor [Gemmataceae bacterium]